LLQTSSSTQAARLLSQGQVYETLLSHTYMMRPGKSWVAASAFSSLNHLPCLCGSAHIQ